MTISKTAVVQVEVFSDVICPWCYVGKARLDNALEIVDKSLEVSVVWKPFELNPTMPEGGMDRKEYLMKKFGSSDISQMEQRLNAAGNPDGKQFNFGDMKVVPNTFKAHRLLWFAHTKEKQQELAEVLFRKYFTDGLDMGDNDVLIAAAKEAGLAEVETKAFLLSDTGTTQVKEELAQGAALDIHSVPTFVINGKVVAAGAVAASILKGAIEHAADLVKR